MKKVRVRYAPSPTGFLHIGNARTALFDYLIAKHYDGDFILRIEDTDIERNVEGGEESQLHYLNWLGIIPDESPQKPNPKYAPYRQMERLDIYNEYVQKLLDAGHAYKCYCTSEELEEDYLKQKEAGYASTRYNRRCLHLSDEERKAFEDEGRAYSIRLRVPDNKTYTFEDMVRGTITFESKDIGDWVLVKSNGIPTYNFAVVIDDALMEISHVFRGEEHISNTPKQLMLFEMLGLEPPRYGHMTLIVNENGKKLSKRDNDVMQFISQYEEAGYLPQALFNFMSLLGWSPIGEQELFSQEELIEAFDEARLSKAPSMFDVSKLRWMNGQYMKQLDDETWYEMVKPFAQKAYDISNKDEAWLKQLLLLYKDQLQYGAEIGELISMFFEDLEISDEAKEVLELETTKQVAASFYNHIPQEWTLENVKEAFNKTKAETGLKGKPLFMGLRVSTTHQVHGPDLMSSLYLTGKDKVEKRLYEYIQ